MGKLYIIKDNQKVGIFQRAARFLVKIMINLGKDVQVTDCDSYNEVVLRHNGTEQLTELHFTNLGDSWSESIKTRDLGHEVGK
jgi:hypothetical protein